MSRRRNANERFTPTKRLAAEINPIKETLSLLLEDGLAGATRVAGTALAVLDSERSTTRSCCKDGRWEHRSSEKHSAHENETTPGHATRSMSRLDTG